MARRLSAPTGAAPHFVEVSHAAGIDFVPFDPVAPLNHILETIGIGLGWLDFDGDGWFDVLLLNAAPLPPRRTLPWPTLRLYRNHGEGNFQDVTPNCGLLCTEDLDPSPEKWRFPQGCAVADWNNDGMPDLFLTAYGSNRMYQNNGDGTFTEMTESAGVLDLSKTRTGNPHWSTSAAFGSLIEPDRVDLFVCRYGDIPLDESRYPFCGDKEKGIRLNCAPQHFPNDSMALYHNLGDGQFVDISESAGIAAAHGKGLGVVILDLDDDHRSDVFVASDQTPQLLFQNLGGSFSEIGVSAGVSLTAMGSTLAGMGVDAADVRGVGRPDLFVTNFYAQPNIYYRNLGNMSFEDANVTSGLGPPSLQRLGFGTCFFDFDNNGVLDCFVANGHVERYGIKIGRDEPFAMEAQLFCGDREGHFRDISSFGGDYFKEKHVGRGLAMADYNNDGRMDLAQSNIGESPSLLENLTQTKNHWLRLYLVGVQSNRDGLGAEVIVEFAGRKAYYWIKGGVSYLSAHDPRLLVGLEKAVSAERVTVRWPNGLTQVWTELPADSAYRLYEGLKQPYIE